MKKMFCDQNGIKPFRIAALILLLIIGSEIYGITHTPTYENELRKAKETYENLLMWSLRYN